MEDKQINKIEIEEQIKGFINYWEHDENSRRVMEKSLKYYIDEVLE